MSAAATLSLSAAEKRKEYLKRYRESGKMAKAKARYREKNKDKIRAYRSTEAYKESQRRYRESSKGKATRAIYRASPEYKEMDRTRPRTAHELQWRAAYVQSPEYKALQRAYSQLDTVKAARRARYLALKLASAANNPPTIRRKQERLRPLGEVLNRALLADPIYSSASKIVSQYLPPDVRDDTIMNIILAILDGTHALEDIAANLSPFIPAHYKENGRRYISIDATIPGTDNLRLVDTISSDHACAFS